MIMFIYHNLPGGRSACCESRSGSLPRCVTFPLKTWCRPTISIGSWTPSSTSFVRDWVRDKYAERGRPAVDPVVFFRLQLVMFFEGIRSERKLMEVAADRLSLRWYLAYDLDERLPDHSSLTKIRQRLGLEMFQRFFERVVE